MRHSILTTALQAVSFFLAVASAQSAIQTGYKPVQTLACYKKPDPLVLDGDYAFATDGWCQQECGDKGKPVMALAAGSTCYCGDEIPPLNMQVSNDSCNTPCNGFGTKNCGGIGFYQVYLTGLAMNVETAPNSTDSDPTSSSKSASPSVVTQQGQTVVVTATGSPSSKPSKVGIAVGVVIGLIVLAAIIGGLILFLKRRKRLAIEEEHKRNAAISGFVAGGKQSETSSATDQRLDPSVYQNRRGSVGSIADEMDFSRRILQVRNPDHRASAASGFA